MARLTEASKEGQLSERGKPEQFQGAYAEIVRGVNDMLDAILLPIGEGNRILAQISAGKIDELIAQTYKGDHEKMKLAVNNVASVVQSLQKEMVRLTEASKEGQLSERGKPEQFQGAYAEIVRGVNDHAGCDSAADWRRQSHPRADLERQDRRADRADLQGRSRKDEAGGQQRRHCFAEPAEGIGAPDRASNAGQALRTRQTDQFQGAYAEIVRGVNSILDAVITPLNVHRRVHRSDQQGRHSRRRSPTPTMATST
jgi:methyl-accepting chemotaxis protein